MLALRSSPHQDTGLSPVKALVGFQMVLLDQYLSEEKAFLEAVMAATGPFLLAANLPPPPVPLPSLPEQLLSVLMVVVWTDVSRYPWILGAITDRSVMPYCILPSRWEKRLKIVCIAAYAYCGAE